MEYKGTKATVRVPDGVTAIAGGAFMWNEDIKNVILPDSVTSIGAYAFAACINLESINLPDGITKITDNTFESCFKLDNITLPANLQVIGYSAFASCLALTGIVIPDGVTTIAYTAFSGCQNMRTMTIPDSVVSIGEGNYMGEISYQVNPGSYAERWLEANIHGVIIQNKSGDILSKRMVSYNESSLQLKAIVADIFPQNIKWSSDNTSVATVDANGLVTFVIRELQISMLLILI